MRWRSITAPRPTRRPPINLSRHTYWNTAGTGPAKAGNAALPNGGARILTIHAASYTPVDSTLIPTGEIAPVAGTPFDFRTPTAIGARIDAKHRQLQFGGGYDHNFVLDPPCAAEEVGDPRRGAHHRAYPRHRHDRARRAYSGNFLDGTLTESGEEVRPSRHRGAFETQHYPDSPNHPNPSVILRPGQTFTSRTVFSFGVKH
ncbi:MAG: hypothetical protein U0164_18910 [Gemmatimonadaceae bacterium]